MLLSALITVFGSKPLFCLFFFFNLILHCLSSFMLDYSFWFWPIALKNVNKKKKPGSKSPMDSKSSIESNLLFSKEKNLWEPSLNMWPWAIISPSCLSSCQLHFFLSSQPLGYKQKGPRDAFCHVWIDPSFQEINWSLCVEVIFCLLRGQSIWGCLGLSPEPLCSESGLCVLKGEVQLSHEIQTPVF